MSSNALWWKGQKPTPRYILGDRTLSILGIIYRPVFYLNHSVAETRFCLRLQVEPTQLGQIQLVSASGRRQCPDNAQNYDRYIHIPKIVEGRYFTTDGQSVSQSVSMSWYREPLCDLRLDINSSKNVAV
jgi:hypothetical protein